MVLCLLLTYTGVAEGVPKNRFKIMFSFLEMLREFKMKHLEKKKKEMNIEKKKTELFLHCEAL